MTYLSARSPFDAAQRAKLIEIANKCPVHKTPTSQQIGIETSEAPVSS